jgi:hypothetical protein
MCCVRILTIEHFHRVGRELTFESEFRRSIHAHAGSGTNAGRTTYIDDGAAALFSHRRENSADENERGEEVGVHLLATFLVPDNERTLSYCSFNIFQGCGKRIYP